eukprot:543732-Hanusia_phi.AAC.1
MMCFGSLQSQGGTAASKETTAEMDDPAFSFSALRRFLVGSPIQLGKRIRSRLKASFAYSAIIAYASHHGILLAGSGVGLSGRSSNGAVRSWRDASPPPPGCSERRGLLRGGRIIGWQCRGWDGRAAFKFC